MKKLEKLNLAMVQLDRDELQRIKGGRVDPTPTYDNSLYTEQTFAMGELRGHTDLLSQQDTYDDYYA